MAVRIKLVQGDTRPNVVLTATDEITGLPISIQNAVPRLKIRESGSDVVKEVLVGTTLPGRLNPDGSVTTTAPYDLSGAGGRMLFAWTPTALDTAGSFDAEVEITFDDGRIQTVYDVLKLKIRGEF